MTAKPSSLSETDIREIISHLDASIVVLDNHQGHMSATELSLRSMMGALRRELAAQLKSRDKRDE